ncbi:MAG: efflux RND transporter periplasmic adaptor subunit [Thermoanaerobaculia bacterium]
MKPRLRRNLLILLAFAAVVAAGAGYLLRPQPIPVQVARVARGRVEQTATNSRAGTVKARRRARLSPDTGGRVVALPRRRGERVRAGEVVLELDSTLERGEVALRQRESEAARANREQACIAADRAARELERQRRLAAEMLVAPDVLDGVEAAARGARAACAAAEANLATAGAALDLARRALAKRTLTAPFDGVVADLATEVGEWVTPSPPGLPIPPVVDILDPESIYLSLPMDEVDAARLVLGQRARATVDSQPGKIYAARVTRVAPYVLDLEAQNRTVEIEVELEARAVAAGLLPGTSADVEVILAERADVLRLPTPSILAGDQVLVVEKGKLVERKIRTGIRNWDFCEVIDGLQVGDPVVTSLDRPEIKAGASARIVETGAAATP